MKATFEVIGDPHKRKFNVELLINNINIGGQYLQGRREYEPLKIKVKDPLLHFCWEWIGWAGTNNFKTKDIILENIYGNKTKLINCIISTINTEGNIELNFNKLILTKK